MLDYTKIQKKTFTVKLYDGTTLICTMPKKRTFEKMALMKDINADTLDEKSRNDLYEVTAEILSCNMQKKKYTADEVGEMFDIDDVIMLFNEYTEFTGYATDDPN